MDMCIYVILIILGLTKTFIVECDALGHVIVIFLLQGANLSFERHYLKRMNIIKPIYEKEMVSILHAIKKCLCYLLVRYLQVKIDHDSYNYFLDQ